MSVHEWWWLGLGIAAVVVTVVAILLALIIRTAQTIDYHARQVWLTGKEIAGNTAAIWMFDKVVSIAGRVRRAADTVEDAATAMNETLSSAARER